MENNITYQQILELFRETDKRIKELSEEHKKTELESQETKRQLKELGKQIGGLHRERGTYTEIILMNSIEDLLINQFNLDNFYPGFFKIIGNDTIQVDALAYTNSTRNEAVLVEVKTKLNFDDITQLQNQIKKIDKFLPEVADKKKKGVIIALHSDKETAQKVIDAGFYFATVKNDLVKLKIPDNFIPKVY